MSCIPDRGWLVAVNFLRSSIDAEQEANPETHDLVGEQKEDRSDEHHNEHHDRGHGGFLARRPGNLLSLGPHFLQELKRIDLRHACLIQQPSPPRLFRRRTDLPDLSGDTFAAEVRYRAADDARYLLPAGRGVKGRGISS